MNLCARLTHVAYRDGFLDRNTHHVVPLLPGRFRHAVLLGNVARETPIAQPDLSALQHFVRVLGRCSPAAVLWRVVAKVAVTCQVESRPERPPGRLIGEKALESIPPGIASDAHIVSAMRRRSRGRAGLHRQPRTVDRRARHSVRAMTQMSSLAPITTTRDLTTSKPGISVLLDDFPTFAAQPHGGTVTSTSSWCRSPVVNECESIDPVAGGEFVVMFAHHPHPISISSFNFGQSLGTCRAIPTGLGIPLYDVVPSKWKGDMRLGNDKGVARARAAERWPDRAHKFARVKDDGRAEAALLAVWWLEVGR